MVARVTLNHLVEVRALAGQINKQGPYFHEEMRASLVEDSGPCAKILASLRRNSTDSGTAVGEPPDSGMTLRDDPLRTARQQ